MKNTKVSITLSLLSAAFTATFKLLFTDFTSTLHRIEKVLKEVDRK